MAELRNMHVPHPRVQLNCEDESLAVQSSKDECDINVIMKSYNKTGLISHFIEKVGEFADVSNGMDFHDAMLTVQAARDAFAEVPAPIRKRFENDPGQLLAFVADKANSEEAISLGLAEPPPPPSPPPPHEPTRLEKAIEEGTPPKTA